MKTSFVVALIIIASLVTGGVAISKEASIEDLTIELNGQIEVSFHVADCCTEKLGEAIRSGVPTTFTFRMNLYLERNLWPDKKLASLKFKHRIKYDNITKEYQFQLEESEHNLSVKDFEKAKEVMAKVNGAKLMPKQYYLDVKAEIDPVRLPFGLEHIFFFLSFWDVETDWLRYEFTY